MTDSKVRLSVGLAGAFAADHAEKGAHFRRDDVMFHVVQVVADKLFLDDYELREVLPATIPLSYPLEQQSGEIVMMARSDDVGGPLPEPDGARIIGQLDELGREIEVEGPLTMLVPVGRAVILPPPSLAGTFELGEGHPLQGAFYISVIDLLEILTTLVELDPERSQQVFALLDFCRAERLPIAWQKSEA